MRKITFLTICLSLFLVGGLFAQETVWVSTTAAGAADGTSEADAYGSFVAALADINTAGDILRVVGTVAVGSQNITSKNFKYTIEGDAAGSTLTGITDAGTTRPFTINGPSVGQDVTFRNITFTGSTGSTLAGGGVLYSNQANVTINFENCRFEGNSINHAVQGGGALWFTNSTVNITDCLFKENIAVLKGGAISIGGSANVAITRCTFYKNSTTSATGGGSALYGNGSTAIVNAVNCTFFQNTTGNSNQDQGTIRTEASIALTVNNSLFYDNKLNNGANPAADWGAGTNIGSTLTNSIAQFIMANVTNTNSTVNASYTLDLSNLTYNDAIGKVTFTAPDTIGNLTPIDFDAAKSDVGAWDSNINIFKGGTAGNVQNWTIDANWSSGVAPIATDNVAILTGMDATLPAKVTVNNIKITSLLKINSDQSLVVTGTASGSGKVRHSRLLGSDAGLANKWYLVASPVSGEIFNDTFFDKNDIASNNSNKGIATYNPGLTAAAAWTYVQTGGSLNSAPGVGYSMKITPDAITAGEYADGFVGFEGAINDTDVTTPSLAIGFNLLGNPYTSYVNSGIFLGAASTNIDQTQMWVWNQSLPDYEVQLASAPFPFILAPAQGFFVKATSAGAVTFAKSNQATEGGAFQKSTTTEVNLWMTDGSAKRYAKLYYLDNATNGFDSGYEGEVFGGVASTLSVFTDLVADSQGKKYQVQSLPTSDYETTVVAVGVKAEAGKEITFTAEALNLPDGIKVFLEDRLTNTFTRLDEANATYKVTVSEAIDGIGRFYLHTKASGVLSTNEVVLDNISIYTPNNTTLKVTGLPQGKATVKLFNILGKQVMQTSFTATGFRDIALSKLAKGMYIVQLETEAGKLNKKIVLE
jgi:hypothetical protein